MANVDCVSDKRPGREGRFSGEKSTGGSATASPPYGPATVSPLSLKQNVSWIMLGNVVQAAARYGMVVLLIRLCGLAASGRFIFAFAVCTPIWALANLGLRAALVTDARREFRFADYLGLRLLTSAAAVAALAGVVAWAGFGGQALLVIGVIAAGKLWEGLSDIFHARQQQHERMDRVAVALMIRGPLGLLLLGLGAWSTGNLPIAACGFPLAMAATFLLWDLPQGMRLNRAEELENRPLAAGRASGGPWRQPVDWRGLARLSWVTLPLAVVSFEVALVPNIPRYVVRSMLGEGALAVYASVGYLVMMGLMVVMAIGHSASPRLAKYHAAGQRAAFCRLLAKLTAVTTTMGLAGMLIVFFFGDRLLRLIDAQMVGHQDLALCLMVFASLMYFNGPLGRALDATRRFKTHMLLRTTGIVVSLVLVPLLVEAYGLFGAAEAMTASAAVLTILYVAAIAGEIRRMAIVPPAAANPALETA